MYRPFSICVIMFSLGFYEKSFRMKWLLFILRWNLKRE
nr:MAG TPA: hypothetical protein [Caudoviricetes sp.]